MIGPTVATGAIVVEDGALLLVRRGHAPALGYWTVPGGRVEAGEDPRFASFRDWCREMIPGRSDRDIRRLLKIARA